MLNYINWFLGFGAINHFLSLWQRRTFQLASWMGTALLWVPQKSQPCSHALPPHDRYPVAHKLWLDGRCFWPKVKNCWPKRCRHLSSSHWGIFGGSSDWMPKPILARLELGIRLKHFAVSNDQKSDDVIRKRDFLVECYYRQTLRWMNFIEMFFFLLSRLNREMHKQPEFFAMNLMNTKSAARTLWKNRAFFGCFLCQAVRKGTGLRRGKSLRFLLGNCKDCVRLCEGDEFFSLGREGSRPIQMNVVEVPRSKIWWIC